jgi:hypothetical protein
VLQISEVSCEFSQISHTVLYEIITVRLGYHKFFTRWVPKMLMGVHKMQRMASANQRAVKAVDAHTFTKQAEKFKQTLSAKRAHGNCFLGKERSADAGIHATRQHNNVRIVL